ncbi:glycosyl hydrolase family 3 [Verminephrobacter aporrectodeae subsp. tuberculatae]|uniref:Glycosyl hydrolase family 3 n=1 Tax=Verminephrobacter aporrectodeae subsp. tuberculatae TaxID=1110392 RepID=A0ABT3KWK1_9BURK|nr:glycoside hydrolase family 3 N-terminal domain-containing protein [Verminephrobacter aporrectodeae]MCW5322708.1 glycosyl hydrolase family 3 [Verminephrobacter aporrectodeae subsp. tuberculatae]
MNPLADWTLEQKVGQLFILAFPGKDAHAIRPLLERYNIGGCYLSQDNAATFDEARRLCADIQAMALARPSGVPALLGVDQEGAWGVLVPESTTGPGNLALGKTGDTGLTRAMYEIFGREMRFAGFNCVLGPCADINFSTRSPIIDTRAFGETPDEVAAHVAAAVQGAHRGGIAACAKHFPGHGRTDGDTHREIPVVANPLAQLLAQDIRPFAAAIDAGVDLIMTAHIRYPQVDAEHPATLSPAMLKGVLRETLGFQGIVISDSMNMGAIRRNYTPVEASLRALRAGIDMIMLSEEHYDHSASYVERQIEMIEAIVQAVRRGAFTEEELDAIVGRIVAFKQARLTAPRPPSVDFAAHRALAARAAERAVLVRTDVHGLLPLKPGQRLVVVQTVTDADYCNLMNARGIGPNQAVPAFSCFVDELSRIWPRAAWRTLGAQEAIAEFSREGSVSDGEVIVAVTENYPLPGEDFQGAASQRQVLDLIFSRLAGRTVVVGLRSAYDAVHWPAAACGATHLAAYSSRECSARAAARILCAPRPAAPLS